MAEEPLGSFIVIGENIHATRIVPAKSPRVIGEAEGGPALRYVSAGGEERRIAIPAAARAGQDYREGRIKHVKIGNAAAQGARELLLSRGKRRALEERVKEIEHIELETTADFFEIFVEGCQFKPMPPVLRPVPDAAAR